MTEPRPRLEPGRRGPPRETAPSPEWQAAPVMDDRTLRQWWDNVRLRWDCHSTAMEGGSLTCRDTVNLLVRQSLPAADTPAWEIEQMQGHGDAAYQPGPLAQHRPCPAAGGPAHRAPPDVGTAYPARSLRGERLARFVRVGQYKTAPNTLVANDGLVEFVPPDQVPQLMQAWWRAPSGAWTSWPPIPKPWIRLGPWPPAIGTSLPSIPTTTATAAWPVGSLPGWPWLWATLPRSSPWPSEMPTLPATGGSRRGPCQVPRHRCSPCGTFWPCACGKPYASAGRGGRPH